ncbi:MAG: DNA/RNA non-specific endonuclease [Bacteroidales bacterium]|nr:DNA/RNA non-specific endonuclease [Bacteroidales bacterium]
MKKLIVYLLFFNLSVLIFAQNYEKDILSLENRLLKLNIEKDSIFNCLEDLKLKALKFDLLENGLPEILDNEDLICHSAYCLVYDDNHKMAKWTAHIISHEVVNGVVSRTNDFRADTLIKNGTAEELDYFLKYIDENGKTQYDGFGYDRGHLAPSADFRWSAKALSESYYYSNMTPQLPEFNREIWAEIEDFLRQYVYDNPTKDLYLVTAPVIKDDLKKQERSKNKISIPEYHYKIAVDLEDKKGIAFLVPQQNLGYPIESYVVTIDSIENITNINFYPKLSEQDEKLIESVSDIKKWRSGRDKNDVAPLDIRTLPKNSHNTVNARQFYEYPKEVNICGTVVSTHKSKNGHVFINLDKSFPNQVFTATIWKSNTINFSYEPEKFLLNKKVCIKGKVKDYQGTPSTYPKNEKAIKILD